MLAKNNRVRSGLIIFLVLAVFITGCTPPGPRALLKGKKLLEGGDFTAAVEQLEAATLLLPTNAQAWNYYGVALQCAGHPDDATSAYQRALTLDRDLMEAHYNLGCLWLEQNKFDSAKTEFIAYTLRRNNAPEGWLKLGEAQLHENAKSYLKANPEIADRIEKSIRENAGLIAERILDNTDPAETEADDV